MLTAAYLFDCFYSVININQSIFHSSSKTVVQKYAKRELTKWIIAAVFVFTEVNLYRLHQPVIDGHHIQPYLTTQCILQMDRCDDQLCHHRVSHQLLLANILTHAYHCSETLSSHHAENDSWKESHRSRTLSTLEMPHLFLLSHSCIQLADCHHN